MKDWQRLSALLLDAMAGEVAERGAPTWVRVFDAPPEPDAFRLSISCEAEALLGWVAPDDCDAVGLIATGRLRAVGEVSGYAAAAAAAGASAGADQHWPPDGGRVEMACLLARDGTVGWTVRPSACAPAEPPAAGRLMDCLRRCFGLPTDPPPVEPAKLMAMAWLVSILERHTGAGRNRLTWNEVSRLHPLARVISGELPTDCPDLAPGLCHLAASAWTWEDYRKLAEQDDCLAELCEPGLAAWMDEGMFARWILAALPDAEELLAAVRPYLVPSAARRLAHAIRGANRPFATTSMSGD